MAQLFSWDLTSQAISGSAPNPGTYAPSVPLFGKDARKSQFERGIKWANVPGGRADFVVHGGPRVYHVNSLCNLQQQVISNEIPRSAKGGFGSSGYDGTIRFRRVQVPDIVSLKEGRNTNVFGEVQFFTNYVTPPAAPAPPTTLNSGLTRYYPLTSDGTDVVGGFNGEITGPYVEYRAGHLSANAMYLGLNASNYFTAATFKPADMSVSFWIYPESALVGYSGLLGNFTSDWQLFGDGTDANFFHTNNLSAIAGSTVALSVTTWHHVVFTRTANGGGSTNKVYVDGTAAVTYAGPAGPDGGGLALNIGCRGDQANATTARFQDVAMYSRVITDAEALELWNGGVGKVYPFV